MAGVDRLDLLDRRAAGQWFRHNVPKGAQTICLTNPPYTAWREFVGELVKRCDYVVALGPVSLLDTRLRLPPGLRAVHMTARPRFSGATHQHPMPHAWFRFSASRVNQFIPPELVILPDYTRDKIKAMNAPPKKS